VPAPSAPFARLPFFYGWVIVAVACVTMGIGINARTAFSLLFPPLLQEFGWERGQTAGAFSIGFFISTLFAPLIGRLMDRRGPRVVIAIGVLVLGAGLLLGAYVHTRWQLYLTLGVLVSGGSLFLGYTAQAFYLPNWFVQRRGLALGIAFSGVGVVSPVLFPWIQSVIATSGWRQASWQLGLLVVVTLLPLNLIFPRRRPEELGLRADGETTASASGGGAHASNVVDPAWASTEWTLARAIGTARFWWIFVAYMTGLHAWYAVQVHQTRYLMDLGVPAGVAAYALGFVPLTGIVGQIGLGHLSDRIGREWVWTLASAGWVLCYLALLAMPAPPAPWLLWTAVAAQGLLGYGLASVFGAIPSELFQGRHYGTIFGTLSVAAGLGTGLGPWLTGRLYDVQGSYALAFWIAIACSAVSAAAMWLAAPRKVRAVAGRIHRLTRA
jgi:MFS family permease